jgi:hypothetical protein
MVLYRAAPRLSCAGFKKFMGGRGIDYDEVIISKNDCII